MRLGKILALCCLTLARLLKFEYLYNFSLLSNNFLRQYQCLQDFICMLSQRMSRPESHVAMVARDGDSI